MSAEPSATWTVFQSESHQFIEDDPDLNRLFLNSLSGNHARVASLVTALFPEGVALVGSEWWSFEATSHRWMQVHVSEIVEKTIGSNRVYTLYDAANAHYHREASKSPEDQVAAQRAKWVRELYNLLDKTSFRKNVLEQMESRFSKAGRVFLEKRDQQVDLLAFTNGVVDLVKLGNGESTYFRDGRADDYVTVSTGYEFDLTAMRDTAGRAEVLSVLAKILPDSAVRKFMLAYASTMLGGATREQKLVFLVGDGANGKSLIVNALKCVLGGYAQTVKSSLLLA
ncbi:hypothetical protein HDU93_006784, partial [Gonapodya sp. JEL0774]